MELAAGDEKPVGKWLGQLLHTEARGYAEHSVLGGLPQCRFRVTKRRFHITKRRFHIIRKLAHSLILAIEDENWPRSLVSSTACSGDQMTKAYLVGFLIILSCLVPVHAVKAAGTKPDSCMAAADGPVPPAPNPTANSAGGVVKTSSPKKADRVVVIDASPSVAAGNRIFVLGPCSNDSAVVRLWGLLALQLDASDTTGPAALKGFLMSYAGHLAKFSSSRWISHKGSEVDVYVVHLKAVTERVDFTETARKSRFESDLDTLARVVAAIGQVNVASQTATAPLYITTVATWMLGKERANLKIRVTATAPCAAGNQTSADHCRDTLETSIVTGPKEHFFLSANTIANDVRQVTYDAATNTLAPANKPTNFYISTNYSIGDLYENGNEINWANRFLAGIYFGGFVAASQRPFEQFGGIIGIRRTGLPRLDDVLPLQTVSPFVGVVWVRNDRPAGSASAPATSSRYAKGKRVWGISLNLAKALGWIGS